MAEDKSAQQMQSSATKLLHSSPGLPEKLANSASRGPARSGSGRDDRDAMIAELQRALDAEKDRNRSLEDQYKHRVASFVKREKLTMNKIEAMERRLVDGADNTDEHSKRMEAISNMHRSVVTGLECIQNNTAKILQDQEKDLMRAFRARLQGLEGPGSAEKSERRAFHRASDAPSTCRCRAA